MTEKTKRLSSDLVSEIQFLYPAEPDWSEVDNETLVALVTDFMSEPSCATTALGLLVTRQDARSNELARWLLGQEQADQWLRAAAHDVLISDLDQRWCSASNGVLGRTLGLGVLHTLWY